MLLVYFFFNFFIYSYGQEAEDYIRGYGYPFESHKTVTEDGYILTLHRIPYGRDGPRLWKKRKPVFIQHGLLSSSLDFTFTKPNNTIAYLLADECYDVWLGNYRGTRYSPNHLNLSNRDKKYWNYSWHELGLYDLPAQIDYILKHTKNSKLHYIGHSQGTTGFFVMASSRPEYNKKIKLMVALSPIAFLGNGRSPIFRALNSSMIASSAVAIGNIFGYPALHPKDGLLTKLVKAFCLLNEKTQTFCINMMFKGFGPNWKNVDQNIIEGMILHPGGASLKQMIHYLQVINSGKFQQYNYGFIKNPLKYCSSKPPEYNLSKITAPVAIYYSSNDYFCDVKDAHRTSKALSNVVRKYLVPDKEFNHADFIWGLNVRENVYDDVINFLSEY